MATPQFHSYCCVHQDRDPVNTVDVVYHIVCLIASVVGIVGSTVYIAYSHLGHSRTRVHRQTLKWLAVFDAFGSAGILLRSITLLYAISKDELPLDHPVTSAMPICATLSAIIDFSYLMTFSWTLCYAWEARLYFKGMTGKLWKYHLFSFITSAVCLTVEQFAAFYRVGWKCQSDDFWLGAYNVSFYAPIVLVMLILPTLYYFTSREVKFKIMVGQLNYGREEQRAFKKIKRRFRLIVIVFYLCWFINVVNGLIVLVKMAKHIEGQRFQRVLWMLMALLNPMQGLFNAMVYRGCKCGPIRSLRRREMTERNDVTVQDRDSMTESTRLLSSPT